MRPLLSLVLLITAATAAPVPKELKRDPFVGKWNLQIVIFDEELIDWTSAGLVWNIDGVHALTVSVDNPAEKVPIDMVKSPLGWVFTSNGPTPPQLRFDTVHNNIEYGTGSLARVGKYHLDGDTLTICLALPGSPRPEKIEQSEETTAWVLKRVAE